MHQQLRSCTPTIYNWCSNRCDERPNRPVNVPLCKPSNNNNNGTRSENRVDATKQNLHTLGIASIAPRLRPLDLITSRVEEAELRRRGAEQDKRENASQYTHADRKDAFLLSQRQARNVDDEKIRNKKRWEVENEGGGRDGLGVDGKVDQFCKDERNEDGRETERNECRKHVERLGGLLSHG